ncbi:MAG: flippase activity-associated protein Agl23 [Blastocatellia bacterium]
MLNNKVVDETEARYEKQICAIVFILAVIVAVWIRFAQIGVKPFHHDEGVNAYFLLNLAEHGEYKYDPTNYHGPTLYYLARLAMLVFGKTDLALRFTPALFGVLTVLMVWLLRNHLGSIGTPVAAFLVALSPGLVYFSRDFIHEMSFGCFSLGVVVGAWRYAESKNFIWLALMAISAGLLVATKETAIITAAVLIIAAISAAIWDIARRLIMRREFTPVAFAREFMRDCAGAAPALDHALAAVIILVFIHIFFYSSLFTYWQGVPGFFKSIWHWTTERSNRDHIKDFWYYFGILFKLELPLLIGSLLAGIFVALRGTRFWLFVAAWTLGLALAYSIIGYKTPWLMISFLIPMAILSGYAAERIYRILPMMSLRMSWVAVMIIVLIICGGLARHVNFEKHDDNGNSSGYFAPVGERLKLKPYTDGLYGYVYAQTDRDIFNLVEAVKNEADKLPSRNRTGIYVASPDYWPLPWYLRDYDQTAYSGSLPAAVDGPPKIPQPIIIASPGQRLDLDGLPGLRALPQAFTLRPGVELVIYVRDSE